MKTIGSVLKRLLLALGGSASENYLNDITLVDRIAEKIENGINLNNPLSPASGGTGSISGIIRPNLLDNWYFVGGGSQQGEGYFPINSKGQTSYSETGVTIDCWQKDSLASLQVQANGVAFNGSGAISNAFQSLTNKAIYGKTVTASALETNGTLSVGTTTVPTKPSSGWSYKNIVAGSTYNLVFGVAANGTIRFFIQPKNSASIVLAAVKLELGDTQTLAHQENGAWVLNEMPLYAVELLKCSDSGNISFVDTSYYRKMGNLCVLTFRSSASLTTGAVNEWKSLGTLPNGYRPTDRTYGVVGAGAYNGTYYATVKIEAWGDVSVCCTQAANQAYLAGTVTFFTN